MSNILNVLLKGGPNKDRAIRLWHRVTPGSGGLVARTREALDNLNTPWRIDDRKQSYFGEIELKEENKHKILHIIRDKLRRFKWRKAALRRNDMVGLENLNYEKSRALWKKKCLSSHLQRILEYILSNAVWTRDRKFRHTRGRKETSPKCKFCDLQEDETQERIFRKCKKWENIRINFPLAKKVYENTRHTITKACGLLLRSEDHLHSEAKIIQMQWMMASILQARFEAGKQDALENDHGRQEPEQVARIRPHDLEATQSQNGGPIIRCRRCLAFRRGTTQQLAQEHCDGRRRQHRRFPRGPA